MKARGATGGGQDRKGRSTRGDANPVGSGPGPDRVVVDRGGTRPSDSRRTRTATVVGVSDATHLSRTQATYDAVAEVYAERIGGELADKPLDRGLLQAFADLVAEGGGGRVADIGCGPGHVTAHLAGLGMDAFGIDLSPGMLAVARASHPQLRFEQGSMLDLPLADAHLAGIVALYSIIHMPADRLPTVFAEFARVLAPGGHLLLAFQAGDDDHTHLTRAFDQAVDIDAYRWSPEHIAERLVDAGLHVTMQMVRDPGAQESARRAYLMARVPEDAR
ncbi:MAG: methyltransferase [Acidimicrobiales bacterium]|nr:methyltransferase [Acidimicrobiales bacterium]